MIELPDDRLRSIVERSVNNFNQLPIFTVNGRGSIYSQWPGKGTIETLNYQKLRDSLRD